MSIVVEINGKRRGIYIGSRGRGYEYICCILEEFVENKNFSYYVFIGVFFCFLFCVY